MYWEAGHSPADYSCSAVVISCQATEIYGNLRLQQALECGGVQETTLLHLPSEPNGFEALRFSPPGQTLPLLCPLGRELLLASLPQGRGYFPLVWGCLCEAHSWPCSAHCHCALFPWLLGEEVSIGPVELKCCQLVLGLEQQLLTLGCCQLCLSEEPFLLSRADRKPMTPSAGSHPPVKYNFKPKQNSFISSV